MTGKSEYEKYSDFIGAYKKPITQEQEKQNRWEEILNNGNRWLREKNECKNYIIKKIKQRLCKWDERIVLDILREEASGGI